MSVENQKAKQVIIDEIKEKLDKAQSAVVVDYLGITVAQANEMRSKLRDANVDYTVYKNTLMSRAIKGTKYGELEQILAGPSALALSYEDAVAPARVLAGAIKSFNKMEFKGGIIEGKYYDADGVKSIAALPSRDELIAKFLGSIQSPVGTFVRTLAAIAEDKESGAGAAEVKAEAQAEEAAPEAAAETQAADVTEEAGTESQEATATEE